MLSQVTIDADDELSRKVYNFYTTDQLGGNGHILFVLDSYRFETRDSVDEEYRHRYDQPFWNRLNKRDNTISKPQVPDDVIECAREDIQSRVLFESEL